jgi:L-lactate dehydrogenase complex protein LldG
MSARADILQTIRKALGRSEGQPPEPLPNVRLRPIPSDRSGLVQRFVQSLEKLNGKTFVVPNTAAVIPAISALLGDKRIVASNAPFLVACGITGLSQVQSGITDRETLRAACATADIGISSVDYALGETGSFVMLSSPNEARLVSLLPPIHIAIIPKSRILANLDELLTLIPKPAEQTSSMVLITGPSRTADIEQILIRGVHGPGEVYAVIVETS